MITKKIGGNYIIPKFHFYTFLKCVLKRLNQTE